MHYRAVYDRPSRNNASRNHGTTDSELRHLRSRVKELSNELRLRQETLNKVQRLYEKESAARHTSGNYAAGGGAPPNNYAQKGNVGVRGSAVRGNRRNRMNTMDPRMGAHTGRFNNANSNGTENNKLYSTRGMSSVSLYGNHSSKCEDFNRAQVRSMEYSRAGRPQYSNPSPVTVRFAGEHSRTAGKSRQLNSPKSPTRQFSSPKSPTRQYSSPKSPTRQYSSPKSPTRQFSTPRSNRTTGKTRQFSSTKSSTRQFSSPKSPNRGLSVKAPSFVPGTPYKSPKKGGGGVAVKSADEMPKRSGNAESSSRRSSVKPADWDICWDFNSEKGCRWGDMCHWKHVSYNKSSSDTLKIKSREPTNYPTEIFANAAPMPEALDENSCPPAEVPQAKTDNDTAVSEHTSGSEPEEESDVST